MVLNWLRTNRQTGFDAKVSLILVYRVGHLRHIGLQGAPDLRSDRLARCLFDEAGQVAKSDMADRMAVAESMYAGGCEWSPRWLVEYIYPC